MFSHNELLCLFCKKKTHTKIKQMTMVRTFVSSLPMPKQDPSCRLPNAFVTFEPLITCLSEETSISWTLSMCTVLSDILAQTRRFNCAFPLCSVCIDLRFRGRTELTSLKKDKCCGVLPSRVSSFMSLLSPATCTNTPVEMFDGNTTPNTSLLAMISFAMLVSIASTSS